MPSQIKVDEIKNVAGQYKIKTNVFEGQTTAGSITVQGEGTATTNLQQGLAKGWVNFNSSTTARDSFNISTLDDDGTGDYTVHFTAAFSNDDFSVTTGGANGSASATAYHLSTFDHSTTSVEMESFAVSAASVAKADRSMNNLKAHGDLA
tara:strand:+ start:536 stop:985 length:450 start_codon:yes stop_codon:yes gene_type:complete